MRRSTIIAAAFVSLAGAIALPGIVALKQKDMAAAAVEKASKHLAGMEEAAGTAAPQKPASVPATKLEEYKAQ